MSLEAGQLKTALSEPNFIGAVIDGLGRSHIITLQDEKPVCLVAGLEDFQEQGEEPLNIRSGRVVRLDPNITDVHVYSFGLGAIDHRITSSATDREVLAYSEHGFDLGQPRTQKSLHFTEDEMLGMLYGEGIGRQKSGLLSFFGDSRRNEDCALLVPFQNEQLGESRLSARILLAYQDRVESLGGANSGKIAGEFIDRVIDGLFEKYANEDSRDMAKEWGKLKSLVAEIEHLPELPIQEKILAGYLVAEKILRDRGLVVSGRKPLWKILEENFTGPKARANIFLFGQERAKAMALERLSNEVRWMAKLLVVGDHKFQEEKEPETARQEEETKVPSWQKRFKTWLNAPIEGGSGVEWLKTVELRELHDRYLRLLSEHKGVGQPVILDAMLKDLYGEILNRHITSNSWQSDVSTQRQIEVALVNIDDFKILFTWLFDNYPDWWTSRGARWISKDLLLSDGEKIKSFLSENRQYSYNPGSEGFIRYYPYEMKVEILRALDLRASQLEIKKAEIAVTSAQSLN